MKPSPAEVTQLLVAWRQGEQSARDQLMAVVYPELRRMARRYMRNQNPGHTLQTTALIHEAYLKLVGQEGKQFTNRAHFFGVAAQAMRHILVDYARTRQADKRGGQDRPVSLEEAPEISRERAAELVALDEALTVLEQLHRRQSQVVELRYFAGLSVEETADVLQTSPETVHRDWRTAKAWLHRELSKGARK